MATIVIDPGHYGGYNQGVCPGYYEGNAMLRLAQFLGQVLTSMGANVVYTRTTNEQNPSLSERGGMVPNADMFISLHSDASDNASARGVMSYYSVQRPASETFAADIGMAAAAAMGNQFRGAIAWPSTTDPSLDYLGVLRAGAAAGVEYPFLIEHGFHTNMEDCLFLSNDSNLMMIADAEAEVIARYLNLVSGCRVRYIVQSGDSLSRIGNKFGVLWQDIASANNILSPYYIYIGQQLAIPLNSVTASGCRLNYTVKSGDSLYSIGQSYGINWQDIAAANNLTSPYNLTIGQRLVLPIPAGSNIGCSFMYTVQSGDSLFTIASSYGVSWLDVASANGITTPYTISPGQCLILPLTNV